jgi:hypothetical protein
MTQDLLDPEINTRMHDLLWAWLLIDHLPNKLLGSIVRIYFYIDGAYQGRGIFGKKNRKLFQAWAKQDPVGDWKRERCIIRYEKPLMAVGNGGNSLQN